MKISDTNPIRPSGAASVKKRSGVTGSNFDTYLDEADAAASTGETLATSPVAAASLDAMLSLQEMPEEELRRKKAVTRATSALDQLEQLRHSLLLGRIPAYILRNLSNILAEHKERLTDQRLNEVIEDIELRAAVELAKLEMAQKRNSLA